METGSCPKSAIPCRIISDDLEQLVTPSQGSSTKIQHQSVRNSTWACCVGLCMDLLRRLSADVGFRFEVFEVRDRKWGAIDRVTGKWNGLVEALLNGEADMVVTSLKISKVRSTAIDFSSPFLETGITILVGVREGVISPVAFLEPFSMEAWIVVLIGCVNVCALSLFIFEYFSPQGFHRGQVVGKLFSLLD